MAWGRSFRAASKVYFERRLIIIFFMGFASGLPLVLTGNTLSWWMSEAGVTLTAIGLFALIGTPYNLKFIWAPLIDRFSLPLLSRRLGRRRSWMVAIQVALMASIVGLGVSSPENEPLVTAAMAFCVAFFSASQDIVIDAYRIEILDDDQQGAGAAMTQAGYRLGLIAAGAGALFLSKSVDWSLVYMAMAGLVLVGFLVALYAPSPPINVAPNGTPESLGRRFKSAVVEPFHEFFTRNTAANAFTILAFILLYKLGDAYAGVMAYPFYFLIGFTVDEIIVVSKFFGVGATLVGVFIGGVAVMRYGVLPCLLVFGVFQMFSNLMYAAQAAIGPEVSFLFLTIGIENLSGGLGSAAFIAYLSLLCNRAYTGTQFALFTSFMAVGRTLLASSSGWLADQTGWVTFFVASTGVALPGLILLLWMMKNLPMAVQSGHAGVEEDREPPIT